MLMPTVFHENLFDDFFDPFWNDAALERAMNREARGAFGKRGANMMKTDVKQTDNGYEVARKGFPESLAALLLPFLLSTPLL